MVLQVFHKSYIFKKSKLYLNHRLHMLKMLMVLVAFSLTAIYAEPSNVDTEIALEELFSDEDLAAFNEEELEADLFDEISQAEAPLEDVFLVK